MAVNTSKITLQDIYSLVADIFGKTIADGTEVPLLERQTFLRLVNLNLAEIASATDTIERLALLTPDRRWLRYIKATEEEANNGIIRIDLEGQTSTLEVATDPDFLDWQYENTGTGAGIDPVYEGVDSAAGPPVVPAIAPDSFPKIYLPAECNIPIADYGTITTDGAGDDTLVLPYGMQNRIGGANEPLTPFALDMRKVGYGSNDPTDDNYPTVTQTNLFFVDPFLIYALRLITYSAGTDGAIPYSSDAYLNDTWTTILGLGAGAQTADVSSVAPNQAYFTVDGVQYEVVIPALGNAYNVAADTAFNIEITGNTQTFTYAIRPSDTPWQTVATPLTGAGVPFTDGTDRWGALFGNQALWSNRAWYVKVNDFVLRLPDDLRKIKYLWKIPTDTLFRDLPTDATDDTLTTALGDLEYLMYSRFDEAYHYYPITETRFTQLKNLESEGHDFRGTGFYIQFGQQLRLVPRPVDPKSALIAVMYEARPDNIPLDTVMGSFATTYLELPAEAVNVIIYMIAASRYASSRGGGNMEQAAYYEGKARRALEKLKMLYGGRGRQSHDAPNLKNTLDPHRDTRHMGFGYIQSRGRRYR